MKNNEYPATYVLIDPAYGRAFAIGSTTLQLQVRLDGYLTKARSGYPQSVHEKIRAMLEQGRVPQIRPLVGFTEDEAIRLFGIEHLANERRAQNGGGGRPVTTDWSVIDPFITPYVSNAELGRRFGVSREHIRRRRIKLGVPPYWSGR